METTFQSTGPPAESLRCYQGEIIDPLTNIDGRSNSIKGADDWVVNHLLPNWHDSTILAFFNKNGNDKTRCASGAWNERLIDWQTNNIFVPHWVLVRTQLHRLLYDSLKHITDALNAIEGECKAFVSSILA